MCPGYIKKKKPNSPIKSDKRFGHYRKEAKDWSTITGNVIKKCNLKLQWDTTTYPVEWLRLKRLTTASVGKDVEQIEIS